MLLPLLSEAAIAACCSCVADTAVGEVALPFCHASSSSGRGRGVQLLSSVILLLMLLLLLLYRQLHALHCGARRRGPATLPLRFQRCPRCAGPKHIEVLPAGTRIKPSVTHKELWHTSPLVSLRIHGPISARSHLALQQ
jgi:hypothetical protein